MREYTNAFVHFVKRDDGPTAVEYAVMLAVVVVICLAAIVFLGSGASDFFTAAGTGAGTTP